MTGTPRATPATLTRVATGLTAPHLAEAFARRRFDEAELGTSREAAVLVLLSPLPDVVLIERARTLRKHAGQVAFPGGAVDPADPGPEATALRETHEEIGLPAAEVSVLGRLPSALVWATRFHVHAVVGWWDGTAPLAPDPAEVASVRRVPLAHLADPARRTSWRLPGVDRTGPGFTYDDLYVWGFTAYVLDAVLTVGGWQRPWPRDRVVDVPRRFLGSGPGT